MTQTQESTRTGTDDLLPTRRSLLSRLKNWDDSASWQVFFDTYWRLIYNVALKAGCTESEAQEVVQETVVSVAKAMKSFRYDPVLGSFKGWLLQLAGWRITNQLRRRRLGFAPEQREDLTDENPGDPGVLLETRVPPELERLWDAEWEENLLDTALKKVRRQVNPKHFQIFDLCVTKHRSVQDVRRFLGISAMEVYLSRHRVARMVQHEVRLLRQQLL